MKKIYFGLLVVLAVLLLSMGVFSIVNMGLPQEYREDAVQMPEFSPESLADGSYTAGLDAYYADHFPFREFFLNVNRLINNFYYFSPGEDNLLAIEFQGGAEHGGTSLNPMPDAVPDENPEESTEVPPIVVPEIVPPEVQDPTVDPEPPQTEDPPVQNEDTPPQPATDPRPAYPDDEDITAVGAIIINGNRAMEVPTAVNSSIVRYGETLSRFADELGEEIRVFSLIAPNSSAFYSSVSYRTGIHDQKAMIDLCYDSMSPAVTAVDAYSALDAHTNEYIYFRTDHHWTQKGAYYAYTAFCDAAGFTAPALSEYETGTYQKFLGSLYNWTSGYPQSKALKDNPDILTYYLPRVETHAAYYSDTTLRNGIKISVIYQGLSENFGNKYLCYISGDTPVCVIETAAEGGVCMVLKDSYGNAFVPFLTEHYSKIICVDPREFCGEGEPVMDLVAFAKEQGVNDLIVVNYPFMTCSSTYVSNLNALIPEKPAEPQP